MFNNMRRDGCGSQEERDRLQNNVCNKIPNLTKKRYTVNIQMNGNTDRYTVRKMDKVATPNINNG